MHSYTIAHNEVRSLFREKTFLLLLIIFIGMSLASTYIGWSAQHTVTSIYSASAMQLQSEGSPVPPSPFADLPHLFLLKNMIIYVVLIGALLAINIGHSAGMRERKAGVVKILFSRPVQKRDFLIGKILGISFVLMAIMILAAIVSIVSTFFLTSLNFHDIVGILGFYGISFIYLSGFALLGLSFALSKNNSVIALLIPLIIWVAITFVLPELASALYPTSSLNPTLPKTGVLQSPVLQTIHSVVYPFSISEHYEGIARYSLGLPTALNNANEAIFIMFAWALLCLGLCYVSLSLFNKSEGEIHE